MCLYNLAYSLNVWKKRSTLKTMAELGIADWSCGGVCREVSRTGSGCSTPGLGWWRSPVLCWPGWPSRGPASLSGSPSCRCPKSGLKSIIQIKLTFIIFRLERWHAASGVTSNAHHTPSSGELWEHGVNWKNKISICEMLEKRKKVFLKKKNVLSQFSWNCQKF